MRIGVSTHKDIEGCVVFVRPSMNRDMRLCQDSNTADATEKAEIQTFIDKRIAELRPAKAAQVLDVSALPEALRKFAK